jgi:hypothetical protein
MLSTPSGLPVASAAPRETVYDAIAVWALHASRARLAAWAIGGTVDAVGIALVLPGWWLLAMLFLSIASIGAWGLAAQGMRTLEAAPVPARFTLRALREIKFAMVAIGTLAAIAAFYGALLMMLGPRWGPDGG